MKKIILNHKSYLNYDEIVNYKKEIEKIETKYELILFPSIIYLSLFNKSKMKIGAQNFYSYSFGSYTGEINLESLKYMDINYTLVSHSERKRFEFENCELVKEKLNTSLCSNFNTILCVGEKELTKNPFKYIKKELDYFLNSVNENTLNHLIVAYEPSFSIENESQCIDKIIDVTKQIKEYFDKKYNIQMEVLYGGSISKDNIEEILNFTDGVLIGKNSTDIDTLKTILDKIEKNS